MSQRKAMGRPLSLTERLSAITRTAEGRSRAKPQGTASIKRPVLVPVSAHGSAKDRNCALASTMRLTITGHRHHVAGVQLAEHPVKLRSWAKSRDVRVFGLAIDQAQRQKTAFCASALRRLIGQC